MLTNRLLVMALLLSVSAPGLAALEAASGSSEMSMAPGSREYPSFAKQARTEIDTLASVGVVGIRAKTVIWDPRLFGLAVEGVAGAQLGGLAFRGQVLGLGIRPEFEVLTDGKRNSLMLAPGVDGVVFNAVDAARGFLATTSTGFWLTPNLDVSYHHQFSQSFGLALGGRIGALVALGQAGQRPLPDAGLYLGARF